MRYVLLLIVFFSSVCNAQLDTFSFRGIKWGMSKSEVIKKEKAKPTKLVDDGLLYKNVTIDGMKFSLVYSFDHDSLVVATLSYEEDHIVKQNYYDKFMYIRGKLLDKYGACQELTEWKDELFKEDKTKWGFAAAMGYVTFSYGWKLRGEAVIILELTGENFNCKLSVIYCDPEIKNKKIETGF